MDSSMNDLPSEMTSSTDAQNDTSSNTSNHDDVTRATTPSDGVDNSNADVTKGIDGPLRVYVRSALQQLENMAAERRKDAVHGEGKDVKTVDSSDGNDIVPVTQSCFDDVRLQRISADLVTSYSELTVDERLTVEKQLVDVLYLLTTNGLSVNVYCDAAKRRTALHLVAAIPDSARFIKALHAAGAKMNLRDYRQQTALHEATKCTDVANVQALLDCGANANLQDWTGQTALHLASAGRRRLPVMQLLIRCRTNVALVDSGGRTALHVAARSGRPELVRELVVHGKIGINRPDKSGLTAVHVAAMYDVTGQVISILLAQKSADVNARDHISKETPLHKAVRLNMLENAVILLRHRADPNIPDSLGQTAVHLAAASLTDLRVWDELQRNGAKLDLPNTCGLTARQLAQKMNNSVAKAVIAQFDAIEEMLMT